ncbi:hypothetical protein [Streptomyces sp. PTY087I2]|uniref:hypothetical protein n=1 Tax=Streptomyces sp. PTY087I2 TaxID=1819298 RepID=UPI00080BB0C1|nr:hypothetical protein [Streptomyces sp. PTY087I2]OCC13001.1 hypothetical protein A3Q37_01117 [Streptomyces sp. PTY087I2]
MRWSFKLHGGAAAVLSVVALALAALTWLPGRGALPLFEPAWPLAVVVVPAFALFLAALVRQFTTGADRSAQWQAFRCLPGRVRAGLAFLAVASVAVMVMGIVSGTGEGLRDAEARDGRYVAYDPTATTDSRTVEVTRDEYLSLLPSSLRMMYAMPGLLCAAAAAIVLAAGELRRADDAAAVR